MHAVAVLVESAAPSRRAAPLLYHFGGAEVFPTTGIIKKVVARRGFGFIPAEDGTECLFHRGGLDPSFDFDRMVCGERVGFDAETGTNGPRGVRAHGV